MGVSIPDWSRRLRAEFPQLTLHFGLHVEGRFAAAEAAPVAGLHELAHLFPEAVVAGHVGGGGQAGHFSVDVEGRLAASHAACRLRLHELSNLLDRLCARRGTVVGRPGPWITVQRERALAHLLVEAAP